MLVSLVVGTNISEEHTVCIFRVKARLWGSGKFMVGSLFYDTFPVTRLYSIYDKVISE
jgi:hypothetical protein